jgi:two-component system sensor histidine kinase RegB
MKGEISSLLFIRLRWFAFLGQLIILTVAIGIFQLTLPWVEILSLLMLIPVSTLLARVVFDRRISEKRFVGYLLAFDTLLLTAILYQAGGPTNPFTIVYLLHVVLAAVMLTPNWTWTITILSSIGFSSLFIYSRPVPEWESHGAHHGLSLHLHGMLLAYLVVAILVTYFLTKIVGELQRNQRMLERLQNSAMNQNKLASLTTITAGAAHELGTPLATIAVVTHEIERRVAARYSDRELLDDLALLKEEITRCKEVLQQLSEKTGDLIGEAPQPTTVSELLNEAVKPLKFTSAMHISGETNFLMPNVPRKSLTLAVRALLKNAFEASQDTKAPIEVAVVSADDKEIVIEVKDRGTGMDPETLERVGEPFFSTKPTGSGMGLGVYLSKLTVEQLGGGFFISSEWGRGTKVRLVFPANCSMLQKAA